MMKMHIFGMILTCTVTVLLSGTVSAAQGPVIVQWFVGLGTGTQEQVDAQEQVVADFNASRDDIQIELIVASSNHHRIGSDTLATLIANGTPPDVIGPTTGFTGSYFGIQAYSDDAQYFTGQWLDLQPLIDAYGFDLSVYPERLVDFFRTPEGLVGIPFMAYPSLMFYNIDLFNRDLFNEDNWEYPMPPSDFGEPYILPDGTEVEWNWDTVADIAKVMTLDAYGNDATMEEFDPSNLIVWFGFVHQWGTMGDNFSTFGGATLYDAATGDVTIPEQWREHARWTWERLWVDHTMPTVHDLGSHVLNSGNAFSSGNVAMARASVWYLCCIGPDSYGHPVNFDLAPVPAYKGEYFAPTYVDAFRIHESTDNPEEAFEVVMYLQGEAAPTLLAAYGGLPTLESLQIAYFAKMAEQFPSVTNWEIIKESLTYAVAPNVQSDTPAYGLVEQRLKEFYSLLYGEHGGEIDVDAELDKLEADLQAIFDEHR